MKALKYLIASLVVFLAVWSCTDENFGSTDFVDTAVAPTNLSALFNVTTDNTGTVTITPNGEGANFFDVYYGDDTTEPDNIKQGESLVHTYSEGVYQVKLVGYGITGLESETSVPLEVSFKAPENLEVVIENDASVSKKVNVVATADYALMYEVYFGEEGNDEPIIANIGEIASYVYAEPGTYTIKVVAKSAAIETLEYTEEFVVTEILQPIEVAPVPPNKATTDVVSIFSDAYENVAVSEWNPGWGQTTLLTNFIINDDNILQYDLLNYTGIVTDYGNPTDLSQMEFLHFDYWTTDAESIGFKIVNTNQPDGPTKESEVVISEITTGKWVSVEIPLSDYTTNMSEITQMLFSSTGASVFIDNLYFYKEPTASSGLEGTWKLAPEAGALKVGPSPGNGDWWSSDAQTLIDRACFFDDTYVLADGGGFSNVLGADTWLETWQGVATEGCGTPVAPHDGSNPATFLYDASAGTIKINGSGSYLGIPKANNEGELPNVAVPTSITYNVTLEDNDNTMIVSVEAGAGVFWTYKLVRDGAQIPSPIEGTWVMAPEAGSLKVGPSPESDEWWSIDAASVADRECYYNDTYVFTAGSFNNILGTDTWIEGWQGGSDACGTPVAPHDGSAGATYTLNGTTLTLNGTGAYLGLSKVNNDGELPNVAVPNSITYNVAFSDNDNTMTVAVEAGAGVFWTFKLIKEGTGGGGGSTGGYDLTLPIDFENAGFGADWSWNVFENDSNPALEFVGNPSESGINTSSTVAKITALQAGQAWVGSETAHGEMGITWDLSASNAVIKIMVYKTVISDVGIKLANPAGGAQEEIKVANTKTNEWEELTFDFSSRIGNGLDGSTNIDQIVIFPDFDLGGRTSDNVVYFDNITFGSN